MQYQKSVITIFVVLVISGGILQGIGTSALVIAWLDYGNALLYDLPSTLMTRLRE